MNKSEKLQKLFTRITVLDVRKQIFFSMLFITVFLNVFLGNFIYKLCVNAIESNYQNTYVTQLNDKNKIFDMRLNNIVNLSRNILYEQDVLEAMEYGNEKGKLRKTNSNYRLVFDFANDLTSQDALITSVTIADMSDNVYFSNTLSYGTYDFYKYWDTLDYKDEYWANDAEAAKGREVFYGNPILVDLNERNSQISFSKYIINPNTNEPLGYMVVQISEQILKKTFNLDSGEYATEQIFVIDTNRNNDIVYFSNVDDKPVECLNHYLDNNNDKYLFSEYVNSSTGWTIVHSVNKSELSQDSQYIQTVIIVLSLFLVFICIIVANVIANRITKPLSKLEKVIEQVGKGDRNIEEEFDQSEVGIIGEKFKDMVKNNIELSENLLASRLNQREAELLLLQSQINPHFLYNTLDSLYFMAIIEDNKKIAEMVLALSENFKLSLNKGEKYCNVYDVLKKIENYMAIQNMRFNNRFKLNIDVDSKLLDKKVLNFIVQPFVENSIYHGLEPKIGEGEIIVKGYQRENKLIFEVIDNGVGIADEDMYLLKKGYGIKNVIERISLTYGDDLEYGVEITSELSKGTKVVITLPIDIGGEICTS